MCVGRYAAKVMRNERSEMEHNRSEMPANIAEQICIPAGCDFAINGRFDVVAFHLLQNRHQKKPLVAIDTLPGLYYISLFQGTYMLSEADLLCVEFLINVTMLADD